ncbi:uncharacterized protein N7515_005483 [Penicillium bovifimosum]|uniref:Uncharacterized protein n=1 Tax=Penicillium bovifimosum TaxID=126998 RepID=A0A9W9GUF5_9EURO|nr:uncharacterized protein N7515_005483 [Penicillium bovifimosum]KAJ5129444.1 hypothetical protein N7515_005483 [Penicillium bovifimosum]
MPAAIEVTDPLVVVRDLFDDEKLVVDDFERHVGHCRTCLNAVQTPRDGRLCESGATRARVVKSYLFSQNGKHFSTVEYENGKSVRVKIPRENVAVRDLLTALEQGLRLPEKTVIVQPVQPVDGVSYDRTYSVSARQVTGKQSRPRSRSPDTYQLVERAPRSSRSPTSIMYRSPGGSPSRPTSSRGSLYSTDRDERRYESPRRYVEGSPKYHR